MDYPRFEVEELGVWMMGEAVERKQNWVHVETTHLVPMDLDDFGLLGLAPG